MRPRSPSCPALHLPNPQPPCHNWPDPHITDPKPEPILEDFMTTAQLAIPSTFRSPLRRPLALMGWLTLLATGLGVAFPGHALDLVGFVGIAGPMTSALAQLAALGPGIKALVGFIGFVVALISLSALRNFGPVLFYVGLAIFAAVGLVIAGAIMGAVI